MQAAHALTVGEGAVGAAPIVQQRMRVELFDFGVEPGDHGMIDDDVVAGIASEGERGPLGLEVDRPLTVLVDAHAGAGNSRPDREGNRLLRGVEGIDGSCSPSTALTTLTR